MNDIFEPVINKLTQELAHRLPDIAADLKKADPEPAAADGGAVPSATGGLGIAAGPLGAIAGKVPKAMGALLGLFNREKPAETHDKQEEPK